MRKHVVHLSSEALGGREVGTPGHDLARDYIVNAMKRAGLEPGGIEGGWFVPVTIVRRARPGADTSFRFGEHLLARGVEYQIADYTDEVTFEETPLFVGYGLTAPQAGWDDYADVDARGRVVVALTGAPDDVQERLDRDDRYLLSEESKAAVALAAGAKAVVFVQNPRTHGDKTAQMADELAALRPAFALRGIGAAYLTARRATELFAQAGLDLAQYQEALDGGPRSVEVPVTVSAHLRLEREMVEAQNVVGKVSGATQDPPVALGAHYDHLGVDGPGSRWTGPETLHPGADDNASGVAVLLDVARAAAHAKKPARTIYFVATTGEELGLRGARQASYVLRGEEPGIYLNLDMVGRLRQGPLHAYGLANMERIQPLVERLAERAKVDVQAHELTDAHSDHLAFADRGWTAIGLSTGRHTDYHLPSDTVDQLDWRGMDRIEKLVRSLVLELAQE